MATLKFLAESVSMDRGVVQIAPSIEYHDMAKNGIRLINEKAEKFGKTILQITIEYHARKRSLDQNSLMWWTYAIEAHIQNRGKAGKEMVTAEDLYEADLQEHGYSVFLGVPREAVDILRRHFKYVRVIEETDKQAICKCIYGSSNWTVKEMSAWIEHRFQRLAEIGGIDEAGGIAFYWLEFKKWQNDRGIVPEWMETELITVEEYKKRVPLCEATGKPLFHGGGSLAHIRARGMGDNPMEYKGYGKDWMHLCDEAHALWDNGKGRVFFVKKYPHLRRKIENTLREEMPL